MLSHFLHLGLLAQTFVFAPLDVHFFEGEELDCEWFFNYSPYEEEQEYGDFSLEEWIEEEITHED